MLGKPPQQGQQRRLSPSARRVLVEIFEYCKLVSSHASPSARRVLVEISSPNCLQSARTVTLREEGVG